MAGLVRSAASFAILRFQAYEEKQKRELRLLPPGSGYGRYGTLTIVWEDFECAFRDMNKPRSGRLGSMRESVSSNVKKWLRKKPQGGVGDEFNSETPTARRYKNDNGRDVVLETQGGDVTSEQ